jgi:ATP-dependent DNA ligase
VVYFYSAAYKFVIGGYVPSHLGVDAIVVGFYRGKELIYAARVRAGFVPLTRREVFSKLKPLESERCPFANLPETTAGRGGQGLTAENMQECVWVEPKLIAEVEFREWTDANHLRHAAFVSLRLNRIGAPERPEPGLCGMYIVQPQTLLLVRSECRSRVDGALHTFLPVPQSQPLKSCRELR